METEAALAIEHDQQQMLTQPSTVKKVSTQRCLRRGIVRSMVIVVTLFNFKR